MTRSRRELVQLEKCSGGTVLRQAELEKSRAELVRVDFAAVAEAVVKGEQLVHWDLSARGITVMRTRDSKAERHCRQTCSLD